MFTCTKGLPGWVTFNLVIFCNSSYEIFILRFGHCTASSHSYALTAVVLSVARRFSSVNELSQLEMYSSKKAIAPLTPIDEKESCEHEKVK